MPLLTKTGPGYSGRYTYGGVDHRIRAVPTFSPRSVGYRYDVTDRGDDGTSRNLRFGSLNSLRAWLRFLKTDRAPKRRRRNRRSA